MHQLGDTLAEVVICANIGGKIVFWDSQWNSATVVTAGARSEPELSRIRCETE